MRHGFWLLALLWLPIAIVAQAAARFMPEGGPPDEPHFWPTVLRGELFGGDAGHEGMLGDSVVTLAPLSMLLCWNRS